MARRSRTAFAAALACALTGPAIAADRETVLHSFQGTDGSAPTAALIDMHGKLYGTTSSGGASASGTVFR